MAILFFRILLFLLPIALLIVWLRWRARRNSEDGLTEADERKAKITLLALIAGILVAAFSLRYFDDSGSPSGRYVPARVEDGKVIDGHFVEEDKAQEKQETPKEPKDPDEQDSDEQDSGDDDNPG